MLHSEHAPAEVLRRIERALAPSAASLWVSTGVFGRVDRRGGHPRSGRVIDAGAMVGSPRHAAGRVHDRSIRTVHLRLLAPRPASPGRVRSKGHCLILEPNMKESACAKERLCPIGSRRFHVERS